MIKLKTLILIAHTFLSCAVIAQTTVMTNHTNNNGNGSITFNVQNTNTFAITITGLSCHLGTSANNNLELLYNTTPVVDLATPWSFGTIGAGQNGWVSAGTAIVNSNTSNGVVSALSNLCLTIPAGATYQLGFSATTLQYMTLTNGGGANINTFSGGGVNLITGDGIGWGGPVYPSTPANYPRGFIGGITFVPTSPGIAPSVPGLSVVNNTICSGNSTTLSITSGSLNSATNWQWYSTSCGIGSAGTGTSIVVSPVATTTYYARGEGGCGYVLGSCANVSVVVNPNPTVSVNSGSVCMGNSFTMTPSGASTYTYSNGSSVDTPTANSSYTITGADANGCVNTAVSSVTVNALPVISVNSGSICMGGSFTMAPTGASTYTYSNGSSVATPTANSSYTVTGEDANGCVNTAVSSVTVDAPAVLVNSGSICMGGSFTMAPTGASTYTFSNGGSVATPTTNSSYTVTGEDANGCTASAISNVTVNALPVLLLTTSNTLICAGQAATLSASGAATYTWNTSQTNTSITVTPTTSTAYSVNGTDANGCSNTATITQNVSACTSVDQIMKSNETVTVYPNPFNNKLTVLNAETGKTIQVFNCLGACIYTTLVESEKTEIDLNSQPVGVYFIKTGLNTIKIIKE